MTLPSPGNLSLREDKTMTNSSDSWSNHLEKRAGPEAMRHAFSVPEFHLLDWKSKETDI
jgi:hypothetical protein